MGLVRIHIDFMMSELSGDIRLLDRFICSDTNEEINTHR